MYERNTRLVNHMMVKMFAICSVAILFLAVCSWCGVFEFGSIYTWIVLIAGLLVTMSPSLLIRVLPEWIMKYYMLAILAVFIGVLGTNNHIGIYITYALVPIFSCLYFDPVFTMKSSIFAYLVMAISLYVNSKDKYEVVYEGMSRNSIYIAYLLGFTVEYLIVSSILYLLVKRARQMMEQRHSAEEQNRMKSEFLSSMSHEIRTPMNAIIGMADVALRKEVDPDVRNCLSVIQSSSAGLLEIINDILDLSKIEAGKIRIINEPYSLKQLLDDMTAIINARNAGASVPIYYHLPQEMPDMLVGDAVRIKQVMFNYASNAIKYTDEGRIDITIRLEKLDGDYVKLIYKVQDTGHGIRKEDMDKLFVVYSQLDVERNHGKEGTGIGLAISRYFIECMDGTVDVESTYGEGSTFTFSVPQRMVEQPVSSTDAYSDRGSTFFRTKDARILLVDDNELNREVVKALLEPLELVIEEAENGRQAVRMVEQTQYDMILMDSHMPVMNGEEATKHIRAMERDGQDRVPIIAITADAIQGVRERLLENGMDDYIAKPVDIAVMCDMIRKYLPEYKIIE